MRALTSTFGFLIRFATSWLSRLSSAERRKSPSSWWSQPSRFASRPPRPGPPPPRRHDQPLADQADPRLVLAEPDQREAAKGEGDESREPVAVLASAPPRPKAEGNGFVEAPPPF